MAMHALQINACRDRLFGSPRVLIPGIGYPQVVKSLQCTSQRSGNLNIYKEPDMWGQKGTEQQKGLHAVASLFNATLNEA